MLIIECTHCRAKYHYDEARFEGRPGKKIRCAKCHEVFEIRNPSMGGPDAMDSTVTKRRPQEPEPERDPQADPESRSAPPATSDATLQMPTDRRLSLALIDGPDAGKVFRIEQPRVVIGRAAADLILNDTESSRNHAAIEVRESLVLLEDLGSTNGTLIDGERINGPVELQNQMEFQVGSTTLMLIVTETD
ncbi:MAG: FHA domain-containing protein [Thermoanaerobaculia bacterium]